MSKYPEMPEWYEKKCREYVQKTYPSLYKNAHPDCDEMSSFCFSILWPQIEVMKEALVWNAHTIVLDNIYDEESTRANVSNFLRCVVKAKEALIKVEAMK